MKTLKLFVLALTVPAMLAVASSNCRAQSAPVYSQISMFTPPSNVALTNTSFDNNTMAIGDAYDGIVYLYNYQGGNWSLLTQLQAPNSNQSNGFGNIVRINGNNLVVVDKLNVLYFYRHYASGWAFIQQIQPPTSSGCWNSGDPSRIDMSLSGNTFLIEGDEEIYQYTLANEVWNQDAPAIDGATYVSYFGSVPVSFALNNTGILVVEGINPAMNQNNIYVFKQTANTFAIADTTQPSIPVNVPDFNLPLVFQIKVSDNIIAFYGEKTGWQGSLGGAYFAGAITRASASAKWGTLSLFQFPVSTVSPNLPYVPQGIFIQGNNVIVGAVNDTTGTSFSGPYAAFVFQQNGSAWNLVQTGNNLIPLAVDQIQRQVAATSSLLNGEIYIESPAVTTAKITLSLNSALGVNGTITSTPAGINCDVASGLGCVATFPQNQAVQLNFVSNNGSSIEDWGNTACNAGGTGYLRSSICTVTPDQNLFMSITVFPPPPDPQEALKNLPSRVQQVENCVNKNIGNERQACATIWGAETLANSADFTYGIVNPLTPIPSTGNGNGLSTTQYQVTAQDNLNNWQGRDTVSITRMMNPSTGQVEYLCSATGAYAGVCSGQVSIGIIEPSPIKPPSPDGSTITATSGGNLVTSAGTWTLGPSCFGGNIILLNGTQAGNGIGNLLLVFNNGEMFAQNSLGNWYEWTGTGAYGWVAIAGDPRPLPKSSSGSLPKSKIPVLSPVKLTPINPKSFSTIHAAFEDK